jgi:hypothetical protein
VDFGPGTETAANGNVSLDARHRRLQLDVRGGIDYAVAIYG